MRTFLSGLPNADLPDVAAEADHSPIPVLPAIDDDLIRPDVEDQLYSMSASELGGGRTTPLAKYLLWTFGPDSRALPFPIQIRTEVEDDAIVTCDVEIGWLHQGLERKLANNLDSGLDLMGRINPRAPLAPRLAFIMAAEQSRQINVPPWAAMWRSIGAELERIHVHLQLIAGVAALGRANLRTLNKAASTVSTLLRGALVKDGKTLLALGGLASEPSREAAEKLKEELPAALHQIERLRAILVRGATMRGKGVIDQPTCLRYAIGGPAVRATGKADDVRLSDPYCGYTEFGPRSALQTGSDIHARLLVRWDEIFDSANLIQQMLSRAAELEGAISAPTDDAVQREGIFTQRIEAPSGELSATLLCQDDRIRVRLSTPSFHLASALPTALVGVRLDEVIASFKSLGISGYALDR